MRNGKDALLELAFLVGRVLLLCFSQWLVEHPGVKDGHGYLFADNITNYISDIFKNESVYTSIGLNQTTDLRTIVKAFFYSDSKSHYWLSRNLSPNTTFMGLWDKYCVDPPVNCKVYASFCNIRNKLLQDPARDDRIHDFRVSEKLFLLQYYSKSPIIGRNVYKSDQELDADAKSANPRRFYSRPTAPQFYRHLINRSLQTRLLNIPRYGSYLLSKEYNQQNYSHNFFFMVPGVYSTWTTQLLPYITNEDEENEESYDPFVIWPGVPLEGSGWHTLVALDNKDLVSFFPYTAQAFNATNSILYNNKSFDVSDRYYRMHEEDKLGGHAREYKTAWVLGDIGVTIADNLTNFVTCTEKGYFGDCLEEYLKWYDSCGDCEFNKEIVSNFKLLGLYNEKKSSNKSPSLALTLTLSIFGALVMVMLIFVFVISVHRERKVPDTYQSI